MARQLESVDIERIFLYEENPRHEPIEGEPEVIEYLCKDEQVYNLARSIAEAGPNPLELLGCIQLPRSGKSSAKKNYQVWEGNRRVCAIKLLNDPDLAPAHLRKDFARLASSYIPIKKINVVIFDDHDELKFWMGIIHNGAQAGAGRINWDAQQKARHFGSNRNRIALAVLDASEAMGFITNEERDGKLTTAQRFLSNNIVREAIGIDASNPDDVSYNRPLKDFQKQLQKFITDLKSATTVNSRKNRIHIDRYGRSLARNPEISGERIEPLSLKTVTSARTTKQKRKTPPKKPRKLAHIEYDKTLASALERIENTKLDSLYYSICSVHIEHVPLLAVGVWAFIESLTTLAGKKLESDFVAYFSNQKLADFGLGSGKKLTPIRSALTRIQHNGNATKHHEIAASFDRDQLANDVATITPLLTKAVDSIADKK